MSNVVQIKTKHCKVQTTFGYKQTKLNLDSQSNKQSDESKAKGEYKKSKRQQDSSGKVCSQAEPVKSEKEVVHEVPAIVTSPEIRRVMVKEGVTKVVIDLETTSRAEDAEICQIAATDGSDEFNIYIIPRGYVTSGATAVNKLRKRRGALYQGRERLKAVYLNQGIARFLAWLKMKTPSLLIAHNGRAFDAKHLINAIASCKQMSEFSQAVIGFSDSLTAFRELFPERKTYKQTDLAKDLLRATYNAHNALDDVRILQKLVSKFITNDMLLKHSFTVFWYRDYLSYSQMTQENMKTLKPLVKAGKASEGMAAKIAGSGLRMSHLEFVYRTGGVERLREVLTELHGEKPRVTNNKKIQTEICSFFTEITKE
ncbi:uncharacterized protein LOC114534884 [Dendronephthya gigantea]|uniref:uncharacterized protein LOC114534884 n=1 Tax=Dendronephthya gigantea TaxID=151771 RepID=UPI00106B384C|nr:uncharacterized protein LOC114534884 [Dendronephthya gigantea]